MDLDRIDTRSKSSEDLFARLEAARHVLQSVAGARSPLVLFDRDALTRQVELWRTHLGVVEPHFAVKACNAPAVLAHLHALGLSFDAATAGEIRLLEALGVPAERVICTHPIRDDEDLRAIATYRPRALVVENAAELQKLAKAGVPGPGYAPELFVRIELPFGGLSSKFGAEVAVLGEGGDGEARWHVVSSPVRKILEAARQVERDTGFRYAAFGLSSHVGTNTTRADKYKVMLRVFAHLCERLAARGFEVSILDLGGGYCDPEKARQEGTTQEAFLAELGALVRGRAEAHPGLRFIAEPGRFVVSNSGSVVIGVMHVDERRLLLQTDGSLQKVPHLKVQMNDGLYGNLLGERHDEKSWQVVPFRPDEARGSLAKSVLPAILNGKTCDSWDRLARMRALPRNLRAGDCLLVPHAGAYTLVTATDFNSAPRAQVWLYWRGPAGLEGRLFDARGGVVAAPAVEARGMAATMPSSTGFGAQSEALSLSRVVGSASVDRALLRPAAPPSDERWREPLSLVYANDVTLRVNEVAPLALARSSWALSVRREGAARPLVLRIGRTPVSGERAARFRADVAALPRDPRIPPIEELGILAEGGHPYVLEPYVEGRAIDELAPEPQANADWRQGARGAVLELLEQAALALAAGHAAGCLHGDVRPACILVPDDPRLAVMLRDWDLFGGERTPAGDVRALGATLSSVAGGRSSAPELDSILRKVLGSTSCVDAAELARELRRFLDREVVLAHRESLSMLRALAYLATRRRAR